MSKGHPAESVRCVAKLGQCDFGESRVQEALPKQEELIDLNLRWHFIGRLQSNKVRPVVKTFDVIHSVDSLALAERVSRIAVEEGRQPEVLLQVKLRPDPSKGGLSADELGAIWSDLQALPGLRISGLMTMAPLDPAERSSSTILMAIILQSPAVTRPFSTPLLRAWVQSLLLNTEHLWAMS